MNQEKLATASLFYILLRTASKQEKLMKILITAGMHGNEQSALLAVMKYREMIAARDDLDLDVDFAIINHYGLFNDQRNMPETLQENVFDPNRMWEPVNVINGWGNAASAAEAIKEKLKNYELVIDVHNSPAISPCVVLTNSKCARNYVEFCNKNDIPFVAWESDTPTVKQYANEVVKIPAFTVELPEMNSSQHSNVLTSQQASFIDRLVEACRKSDDCMDLPVANRSYLNPSQLYWKVQAHEKGIVELLVELGASVKTGDPIAKIHRLPYGFFKKNDPNVVTPAETVVAPVDGRIMVLDNMVRDKTDDICWIQPDVDLLHMEA